MTGRTRFCLGLAALAAAALASPASAQNSESDGPRHLTRGTLLIFPVWDTRPGFDTVITVTNTNTSRVIHENRFRTGDVLLHFTYVDSVTWREQDLDHFLTPGDTISVLATEDTTDGQQGWLWVEARDPENPDAPIDFDFLIGGAILTNNGFNLDWKYCPYVFRSLVANNEENEEERYCDSTPYGCSGNGHAFVEDGDHAGGEVNFDGVEYDFFPDHLIIPMFFGEGSPDEVPGATFANTLYLMSTEMTGTVIDFLGYNNNEVRFSAGNFRIDCYSATALSFFNQETFTQRELRRNYDPTELKGVATGWTKIFGSDPILGCFMQHVTRGRIDFIAGDALHYEGTREASFVRRCFGCER